MEILERVSGLFRTKLPNTYLHDYNSLDEFFNGNYADLEAYKGVIKSIEENTYSREALRDILFEQNKDCNLSDRTKKNIEKLESEKTFLVCTGHQPCLFGGPLYVVYKSLSALNLSKYLQNKFREYEFVPLFWMGNDDSDFSEIDNLSIIDKNNKLKRFAIDYPAEREELPFYKLPFRTGSLLEKLSDALRDTEFKQGILESLQEIDKESDNWVESTRKFLSELFGEWGLVIFNPSGTRVKELSKDIFKQEVKEPCKTNELLSFQSERLNRKGFHSQIKILFDRLNIFFHSPQRTQVLLPEEGFEIDGESYSEEEVLNLIEASPQKFSPNVALRPIMQDKILPTVAYVGGPSEVSYFAQLKKVYNNFEVTMPIIYPRHSMTLLEKYDKKLFGKYDIDAEKILRDKEDYLSKSRVKFHSTNIMKEFERRKERCQEEWQKLASTLTDLDPNLEDPAERLLDDITNKMDILRDKAEDAIGRKTSVISRQFDKLENKVIPSHRLQERQLSILSYLVKYPDIIREIEEAITFDNNHQHLLMEIENK